MKLPVVKILSILSLAFLPAAGSAQGLVVDKEKKEVRLPFTFVEPSRAIEVFACSPGGPTHETVVVFHERGSEIGKALNKIGCRNQPYWVLRSSQDFDLIQGDRVIIILKWEYHGHQYKVPAEELLWRTGEALPLPVHGFSFKGNKVKLRNPPRERIPDVVEFTVGGGGKRQSAVSSLLAHPSSFGFLADHVSACKINPKYHFIVMHMAAEKAGGTMILRKVNETELLKYKKNRPVPLWGMGEVYDSQIPIAGKLDEVKRKYAEIAERLAEIRASGKEGQNAEAAELLAEAEMLLWRAHTCYISMYDFQWKFEKEVLETRLQNFMGQSRRGYDFLRSFAPERLKLAELRLQRQKEGPSPKLKLRIHREEERLRKIQKERDLRVARENLEFTRQRLEEEKKRGSAYLVRLFKTDLKEAQVRIETLELQIERHELHIRQATAELEGQTEGTEKISQRLEEIEKELPILKLRMKVVETEKEIRWAESDSESQNPELREEAAKELARLTEKKKELLSKIAELQKHKKD